MAQGRLRVHHRPGRRCLAPAVHFAHPAGIVIRDVFGNADTRAVLLLLDALDKPMQYSRVREELDIHPEAFKRSLDRLEHHAMIGRILSGKPNNLGRRPCHLEATAIGRFWAEGWQDFQTRHLT